MSQHAEVKSLAKRIAKDMAAGRVGDRAGELFGYLEENPDTALTIIDLLHEEASRKKPNDDVVESYLAMFAMALELIRYQVERGYDWADQMVEAVREQLLLRAQGGVVPAWLLIPLLDGFRQAGLEPGEALIALAGQAVVEGPQEGQDLDPAALDELLNSMATEFGDEVFGLYGHMADFAQNLPPEFRRVLLETLAESRFEALREAAILALLDPAPEVRNHICRIVGQTEPPSQVSPVTLRRAIALRNWLPEQERPLLDSAIKKLRRAGVACAAWPARNIVEVLATGIDGAGAQSAFAVVKDGRKHVLASLLFKQGKGVADAWCLRDQSKSEVAALLEEIEIAAHALPVTTDFVALLVRHHLAVGLKHGAVPPVGLLEAVEALGLAGCQPAELDGDALVELLAKDIDPAHLRPTAVARALEASVDWPDVLEVADSWFEDGAEVDDLMRRHHKAGKGGTVALVLDRILESRRAKWADRFFWMALWAKHARDRAGPWHEFYILGREVHGGRPLGEIPIMTVIAEETIAAAAFR